MKVLRISGIKLSLDENEELLAAKAAVILDISVDDIAAIEIIRKAIDARRHKPPHFVYVVKISVPDETILPVAFKEGIQLQESKNELSVPPLLPVCPTELPVIVIGSGPAGIFAAYFLAQNRMNVLYILTIGFFSFGSVP